jgi:nitrogen fixation/metabolism regulation signal transduction histidine kinase
MGSKALAPGSALPLAMRAMLAGGLAFLLLEVLARTSYFATAAALAGLILLTLWDASRFHRPAPAPHLPTASREREGLQRLDRATALLDAVTVALIALTPDGRISFANRAARLLAGEAVRRLADIAALGADAADRILAMPIGARRIFSLADGRLVLAWAVEFSIPGRPAEKLVSLQAVAGELDAVQLRAWQDMTRVLSHEIMNSLTPIASLSESAADLLSGREKAEPQIARAVNAIARRSLHLIDFVERYRQVAELPEPRLRSIRAAELAADIEAVLQADFVARGIRFECDIRPAGLAFDCDPELLSQAILNLLRNAAEAVADIEAPIIRFSCEAIGAEIAFSMADNGAGIEADRLQEIFVPFFTTKPGGSGVGLTLVRQIALAHGGRIEALNRAGGGALLRMTIPGRDRTPPPGVS